MQAETRVRPPKTTAALAAAAAIAMMLLIPRGPAEAQIYPGWDFGNGFGIGLGMPPSAYNPCPTYGWPIYPYHCAYRYYGRTHHARHYRRYHRYY